MTLNDFIDNYGTLSVDEIIDKFGNRKVKDILTDPVEEKPKTVWDLEEGDRYWIISVLDGKPEETTWDDWIVDDMRRKLGNCFLTKEEAEKEFKKREVEALLKKCADGYQWTYGGDNHSFYCYANPNCPTIRFGYSDTRKADGVIYFPTEEAAKKAVKEIGEKRIIRDFFQIEEIYEAKRSIRKI